MKMIQDRCAQEVACRVIINLQLSQMFKVGKANTGRTCTFNNMLYLRCLGNGCVQDALSVVGC